MYRFDLTDAQWERIAPFFPERYHHGQAGRPWKDHRPLLNGILWHLHTGAPWPDTPERYGPWQTVYDRFNRWRQDGTWANILDALLLRLDRRGFIQRDLWCVDATINRAGAAAAGAKKKPGPDAAAGRAEGAANAEPEGHALGRSQGGFGTKTHLVCDSGGVLLAVWVTEGQRHEIKGFEQAMLRARRPAQAGRKRWPEQAAGDKGYSYAWVRTWLRRHHIKPVIPTRKDQPRQQDFAKDAYRRRNIIERVVGWFKWCRALATRFDKLAVNYVALWIVANIQYLLRNYLDALGP
ncbi:MAG TPA: IS5 family transposase [Gemmataceae bacterium]|nr:IS5 family transposase [Gemmataceae bacterium]